MKFSFTVIIALIVICATFAICSVSPISEVSFAVGINDSTESNPYIINSADDWLALALGWTSRSDTSAAVYVKLNSNISFAGKNFERLGTDAHPYLGVFDGNGKVLTDIVYNDEDTDENKGVFGVIGETASVKNLGVFDASITGDNAVGGIAGKNSGQIISCFANASIVATGTYIGGLVGYNSGTITTSYASGSIVYDGKAPTLTYLGGLVGYIDKGSLSYSYSFSAHELDNTIAGGLAGGVGSSGVTLEYSFYPTEIFKNEGNKRVGNLSASDEAKYNGLFAYSNYTIESNINKGSGLSSVYFLAPATQNAWANPFAMTDGSAFFGPSLAVFNASEDTIDYSFNSVIVRHFGALPGASRTWGTEADNPYIISTVEHFNIIASSVSNPNSGSYTTYAYKYFLLDKDIDFSNFSFSTIGTDAHQFAGKFNGGGHTLSNIKLGTSGVIDNLAPFRYVGNGGEVSNIIIDNTCSIDGGNTVAGLVANLNGGVVSDVVSNASVAGTNYIGGIVGKALNGASIKNCLSTATVRRKSQDTNNYNGVVATSSGAVITNSWYVAKVKTDTNYATLGSPIGAGANTLQIGEENTVNAVLTSGVISFSAEQSEQYSPVFRDESEITVEGSGNGSYIANPSDSNKIIYVRFVRNVEVIPTDGEPVVLNLNFQRPNGDITSEITQYYNGQSVSLIVKISYNYFVKDVYYTDSKGDKIKISDFSLEDFDPPVEGKAIRIKVTFFIIEAMIKLGVVAESMFADDIVPNLTKTYNAEPLGYVYQNQTVSDYNYTIEYAYSTGIAPTASGLYVLTLKIMKAIVEVGRSIIDFNIEKKTLSPSSDVFIDQNYYTVPTKEYDGVDYGFVSVYVNKELFDFEGSDKLNITVAAVARYNGGSVGTSLTAEFTITISGLGADNYDIQDATRTLSNCSIVQRNVIILLVDAVDQDEATAVVTKEYSGKLVEIANSYVTGYAPVDSPNLKIKKTYKVWDYDKSVATGDEVQPVDVGWYVVSFTAIDPAGSYYIIKSAKQTYLVHIEQVAVDIVFSQTATIIYSPQGQYLTASFVFKDTQYPGAGEIKYYYEDDTQPSTNITDVGTYTVVIDSLAAEYSNFKIKLDADGHSLARSTIEVVKKTPEINIKISESIMFGDDDIPLELDGDDAEYYLLENDVVAWSILTPSKAGTIIQKEGVWYLKITGAGNVTVTCDLESTDNYNETTITGTFSILKKPIEVALKESAKEIRVGYGASLLVDSTYLDFSSLDSTPDGYIPPQIQILVEGDWKTYTWEDPIELLVIQYGSYGAKLLPSWEGGSATSDNYDLSFGDSEISFTIIITARSVKLVINDIEAVYGKGDAQLTFSLYDTNTEIIIAPSIYAGAFIVTLTREAGNNAGTYEIKATSITSNNFVISNVQDTYTATYTIKPLAVTITIKPESSAYYSKLYGQTDPNVSQFHVRVIDNSNDMTLADSILTNDYKNTDIIKYLSRVSGEDVFGEYDYGEYAYFLMDTLPISSNYTASLSMNPLRIYPNSPNIQLESQISVQYGNKLGGTAIADHVITAPAGTFAWATPEVVPTTSYATKYSVLFTSSNRNYTNATIQADVVVVPRVITALMSVKEPLVYKAAQYSEDVIEIQYQNVLPGDQLGTQLSYTLGGVTRGVIRDAGQYEVTILLLNNNPVNMNYTFDGVSNKLTVTVQKAPLTISLLATEYTATANPPSPQFSYDGFLGIESETTSGVFISESGSTPKMPTAKMPTEPGIYTVYPEGAELNNYAPVYQATKITVFSTSIIANDYFKATGSFDPGLEIEVTKQSSSDAYYADAINLFNAFTGSSTTFKRYSLISLYAFSAKNNGVDVEFTASGARATIELDENQITTEGRYSIVYYSDGNVRVAKNISVSGNSVTFELEECDYFALIVPPREIPTIIWVYVALGVLFVILLLILIRVIVNRSRRKKERVKKIQARTPARVRK
jgi:hypothetical protein